MRKVIGVIGVIAIVLILLLSTGIYLTYRAASPSDEGVKPSSKTRVLTRLGDDPDTLDPALVSDVPSSVYAVEVFSGLVTLSPNLEVVPDIAERWDISPDRKTYTFYLRKDVLFHDGKPVKASDFKYSFERAANPRTESTTVDTYLGDIVGVKEVIDGQAKEISGMKVLDDHTLQITIDAPKAYFLAKLTYPTAFVVDKTNVEERKTWTDKPNGTGPFKLKEWRKGELIVLERNDHYYAGPARLERINFIISGGTPMTMYENGEIDITGVGVADLERVLDPANPLNKELIKAPPALSIDYIGLNVAKPPFDDVKVRQAFNLTVNREKIADILYQGLVVPATGILPPGLPGYNDDLKPLPFDPVKAKELIAQSKYKSPAGLPPIVLTTSGTGGTTGPVMDALIEDWKQNLGIEVQVQQVEGTVFLGEVVKRKYQMFIMGWYADYPDPQDFLDILLHSKSVNNHTSYNNADVDGRLETARVEADVSRRMKMYQDIEQIIVNEAAWIPLWYSGERYTLIKPYVKGYLLPSTIVPKYRFVYIEGK